MRYHLGDAMATFAIGDIHGWRPPLDELLATLRPRLTPDDTVVFLGDYIDRGDDVKGCIDAVLAFKREAAARVVCLVGNHEEWLLRAMVDPTPPLMAAGDGRLHHHPQLLAGGRAGHPRRRGCRRPRPPQRHRAAL